MKCNSLLFNRMSNGQSKIINYCGHDVQLFKYKIKNEQYYILTSIIKDISKPKNSKITPKNDY